MGVTGTNGKTSVVNFNQQLIEKNSTCVTIGTLGVNGNLKIKTKNTTPIKSLFTEYYTWQEMRRQSMLC